MKIALVIPWYHEGIAGGAEAQCRDIARLLLRTGADVEILTTCIRDHLSDWNVNHFPAGEASEGGLKVVRFPADRTDRSRFDTINAKYMAMAGAEKYRLPAEDEDFFFQSMAPSSALLRYVEEKREGYDFIIFLPYLFATSVYGPAAAGEKSLLIPCLHDEGYASSRPVARSFARTGGIIFNTRAEQRLAASLFPLGDTRQAVVGDSIETAACRGDAELFRRRFAVQDPFILCLGRKDATKRTDLLVRYFLAFKRLRPSPLKLLLAGPGKIRTYRSKDIADLGYLDEEGKYGALAACSLLCNPSLNESFSIVLLEAWANGRPVLAAGGCPPTRELCAASGGGLWFDSFADFTAALDYLLSRRDESLAMGERGRRFTEDRYSADVVAERYRLLLEAWRDGANPLLPSPEGEGGQESVDSESLMKEVLSGREDLPEPTPPASPLADTLVSFAVRAARKLEGLMSRPRQKP